MLRDLFFDIWGNGGTGWFVLTLCLFFICLAVLMFVIARTKAKNAEFNKIQIGFLCFLALIMYQIIPTTIDLYGDISAAREIMNNNATNAIKYEKLAINTSLIPWQKGGYYCKLADLYEINREQKNAREARKLAYKYVKSYKYPCWGISFYAFYRDGDYDTAIEIAKNYKTEIKGLQNAFIARCYVMKSDLKTAEEYIDKAIKEREISSSVAIKAYILKAQGKTDESLMYYRRALQLCKKDKEKKRVEATYRNFNIN